MKKMSYEIPVVEIIQFEAEDVIIASGGFGEEGEARGIFDGNTTTNLYTGFIE